jgi:hypothetical protein
MPRRRASSRKKTSAFDHGSCIAIAFMVCPYPHLTRAHDSGRPKCQFAIGQMVACALAAPALTHFSDERALLTTTAVLLGEGRPFPPASRPACWPAGELRRPADGTLQPNSSALQPYDLLLLCL